MNGFKHDAGPTVITAPFLFDELFSIFVKKREDYLSFVPLEPWYRYYFLDGNTFDYCSTIEKTNNEISKYDNRDIKGYSKLLNQDNNEIEKFDSIQVQPIIFVNKNLIEDFYEIHKTDILIRSLIL